jgi:hypothetical protein
MNDEDKLADELRKASEGLLFMSESDYPLEVVRLGAGAEATHGALRKLSGKGDDAPVREQTVDEFFRVAAAEAEWKSAPELESAKRYKALVRLLKSRLEGLKVFRVGEIDIDAYVLGKAKGGELMGLKTKLVET